MLTCFRILLALTLLAVFYPALAQSPPAVPLPTPYPEFSDESDDELPRTLTRRPLRRLPPENTQVIAGRSESLPHLCQRPLNCLRRVLGTASSIGGHVCASAREWFGRGMEAARNCLTRFSWLRPRWLTGAPVVMSDDMMYLDEHIAWLNSESPDFETVHSFNAHALEFMLNALDDIHLVFNRSNHFGDTNTLHERYERYMSFEQNLTCWLERKEIYDFSWRNYSQNTPGYLLTGASVMLLILPSAQMYILVVNYSDVSLVMNLRTGLSTYIATIQMAETIKAFLPNSFSGRMLLRYEDEESDEEAEDG